MEAVWVKHNQQEGVPDREENAAVSDGKLDCGTVLAFPPDHKGIFHYFICKL